MISLGSYLTPLRHQPKGRVILVPDGDTLRLADRRQVQLACVNAPDFAISLPKQRETQELLRENFHPQTQNVPMTTASATHAGEQKYAAEAHDVLKTVSSRQLVTLMVPSNRRDTQGMLICDAILENGVSLSGYMVARGLAYVVRDSDYPEEYLAGLMQLQIEAMHERRGFWDMVLSLEAASQPWIGDSETGLFYSSTDMRGQQIKPRLRVYFGTLLDAFSSGFAPASSRAFWPTLN